MKNTAIQMIVRSPGLEHLVNDREASQLAARFWRNVGGQEDFPRSLEHVVSQVVNTIAIIRFPSLTLSILRDYLERNEIRCTLPSVDRPLRACLLARAGWGFIFLDMSDSEDEQRFSFAHELSHFLLEHHWPREAAIQSFGASIVDVLNGVRAPTVNERVGAVLMRLPILGYSHLLERHGDMISRMDILDAEDRADRLALELLAPRNEVVARLTDREVKWNDPNTVDTARSLLIGDFGLPDVCATAYGTYIVQQQRSSMTFRDWLR